MYERYLEPAPGRASLHISSIVEAPGAVDEVLAAQIGSLRRAARLGIHQLAERADVEADVVVRLEAGDIAAISAPDDARRVVKTLAQVNYLSPIPLLARVEARLGAIAIPAGTRDAPSRRRVARRDRMAASVIALLLLAASSAWLAQAVGQRAPVTIAGTAGELQPGGR